MREFDDFLDFRSYLKDLDGKKPFDCRLLKVLPEEVYAHEGRIKYEKGALICSATPGSIGTVKNHRCHLQADVILDEAGELEALCGWNHSKFKLSIKNFEPK